MANKVKMLIIHHSMSRWGDVDVITKWHKARGWKTIGYNLVIYNGFLTRDSDYDRNLDGMPVEGRGLNVNATVEDFEIGAHTKGLNAETYGICLIGNGAFTIRQMFTLINLCNIYRAMGIDVVVGHGEVASTSTDCPGFDMEGLRMLLGQDSNRALVIKMLMNDAVKSPSIIRKMPDAVRNDLTEGTS